MPIISRLPLTITATKNCEHAYSSTVENNSKSANTGPRFALKIARYLSGMALHSVVSVGYYESIFVMRFQDVLAPHKSQIGRS
ncbi:hypothetical protein [Burkholderia pyrrocinia]|uniref:hypothetical protein n=1 Tax=Burkholderia pyrrocinia TaxID=60550 RepID=UPI00158DA5EF|nr:hypothetical protein [Burkholderia pyrrocinia]